MRYEACFDCGDDERLHGWEVVEWHTINEKGKIGRKVASFYGPDAEADAKRLAEEKQALHDEMMYELESREWQRYQDEMDEYEYT